MIDPSDPDQHIRIIQKRATNPDGTDEQSGGSKMKLSLRIGKNDSVPELKLKFNSIHFDSIKYPSKIMLA
jgi:hypothetical protein